MRYEKLPSDNHVLRYAAYNRLQRDPETDEPLALAHQAFHLRPEDDGQLSLTWVEYFEGSRAEQLEKAIKCYRASMTTPIKAGAKSAFGVAVVQKIIDVFEDFTPSLRVRVLHDPTDKNEAHAIISQYKDEYAALLDMLAHSVFSEIIPNCSVGV